MPNVTDTITALKFLASGKETDWIVEATGLTSAQVFEVKEKHGYPDPVVMQRHVEILEAQQNLPVAKGPRPTFRARRPGPDAPAAARPAPAPAPPAPPPAAAVGSTPAPAAAAPAPLGLGALLAAAAASPRKGTRSAGERLAVAVLDLEQRIRDEEQAAKAAAKAAAEETKRRARIAELEAELATLRKPTTSQAAGGGPDARTVREWAATAGVACPSRGRVPEHVRAAYLEQAAGSAA
jgi:hypothetical protein